MSFFLSNSSCELRSPSHHPTWKSFRQHFHFQQSSHCFLLDRLCSQWRCNDELRVRRTMVTTSILYRYSTVKLKLFENLWIFDRWARLRRRERERGQKLIQIDSHTLLFVCDQLLCYLTRHTFKKHTNPLENGLHNNCCVISVMKLAKKRLYHFWS